MLTRARKRLLEIIGALVSNISGVRETLLMPIKVAKIAISNAPAG
jgi:hypothetical protein